MKRTRRPSSDAARSPTGGLLRRRPHLRLHPSELAFIARHAEDRVVVVDRSLLPLFAQFQPHVPSIERVIVIADDGPVPADALDYDELIAVE